MKLIVGLGNPGKEYEKTRHNVGFLILDNYLGSIKWKKEKDAYLYESVINNEKVIFIKPLTFMNLSGNAVNRIAKFYKVSPKDILVIHDDLDIQPMTYRFKTNSSDGGHNGIKSIINSLGSKQFDHLKIGIGNNKDLLTADYVLSKFSKTELNNLKAPIFGEMIEYYIKEGIEKTMNKYN